jgi:pimeloyl-ACP methyl ester carboxylesterase
MRAFQFVGFLIFSCFSFQASAYNPWDLELTEHVDRYYHPLENTFVSTVQGQCRDWSRPYWAMDVPVKNYRVKSSFLDSGELPLKMALQRDDKGRPIKAPLIFGIPGAFNNLSSRMPKQFTDAFSSLGYHAITLPNPWGTQYIENRPYAPTGSVVNEGKAIYEAMRKVHNALSKQGLIADRVDVFGVSYGGFLSVMIDALDAESGAPILTGDVTAVSPPFNLGETLNQLDALIGQTQPFIGIGLYNTIKKGLALCLANSNSDIDNKKIKDARGLTIGAGFHADLITSLRAYDKAWNLRSVPHSFWGSYSPVFRRWMRGMSFTRYYEIYAPNALEVIRSEQGDIYSWMERAQRAGSFKTRIMLTGDDFLNDNSQWPQKAFDEETVILENGGHYGFRSLDWYKDFQKKVLFERH